MARAVVDFIGIVIVASNASTTRRDHPARLRLNHLHVRCGGSALARKETEAASSAEGGAVGGALLPYPALRSLWAWPGRPGWLRPALNPQPALAPPRETGTK